MASDSLLKHPLCVEWTTKLPSKDTLRMSPEISVGGLASNLALKYLDHSKLYQLIIFIKTSTYTSLEKYFPVTTFIQHPYTSEPILVDMSLEFFNNILWEKSRREILEDAPNIIDSNKFTIICLFHNAEPYVEKTDVSTQTTRNSVPVDLQSLSRNFSTFLRNESFSDVKLKCVGCTFSAHRLVLAARSEVFAAMFRNKMAEAEVGVVDINDVDPEVLDLLLQYMYLGERLDLCEDTTRRLYEAADKYAVHDLRRECLDRMLEYQTTDNCLDLLVLADKHSDEIFKEAVVRFVAEHLADIRIESWSTFRERHPLLVLSVLEKRLEDSLPGVSKKEKFSGT